MIEDADTEDERDPQAGHLRGSCSIWKDADEIVERLNKWADRYGRDEFMEHTGMTRGEMVDYARSLGPSRDAHHLVERQFLMGHLCSACHQWVDFVAVVGDKPDYESATASMCMPCLRTAVAEAEIEYAQHMAREAKP